MTNNLKRRVPRKKTDINYFRAILKGINDNVDLTSEILQLDEIQLESYIAILLDQKIVVQYKMSSPIKTSDYIISDIDKYQKWTKGNIYKNIERYLIPFMPNSIININI